MSEIKKALEVAAKRLCICEGECYETRHGMMNGPCERETVEAAAAIAAYLRALPNTFLPFSGGGGGHWFASAATDTLAAAVEQEARDA